MSITTQHKQEDLSVVYVRAIASKAGCICAIWNHDYGTDIEIKPIKKIGKKRWPLGVPLVVQIKASQNYKILPNGNISYYLDVDNYNLLIREDTGSPYILVLYCMPKDENEWISICKESTQLKYCGFWIYLGGMNESDHTEKIKIEIPYDHIFDVESLTSIMNSIEAEEFPQC